MDRDRPRARADEAARVVVFDSANPEFFIAHADVALIQTLPRDVPPKSQEPTLFHAMVDRSGRCRRRPIAKLAGRARGGGSEFVLSLDMRFAALGRAVLAPAGGRARHHPGRQRYAAAATAGRPRTRARDHPRLRRLRRRDGGAVRVREPRAAGGRARRLRRAAGVPHRRISGRGDPARQGVGRAAELPTREGLLEEAHYFNQALATESAQRRMAWFLRAGGQTREVELRLAAMIDDYEE
jgi:hypothetical protein